VGDVVLKRLHQTSLENSSSLEVFTWLAPELHRATERGFRVAKPIPTKRGDWLTLDGWTAWTYVEGRPASAIDVPGCIEAIRAFHEALRNVLEHPLLEANATVFGRADRACWDARPTRVDLRIEPLLDALYGLRHPVDGVSDQLIHGDLNPGNILVDPNLPPAFIDVAPFWRPVEFAVGMFANWIGPREGNAAVLNDFRNVTAFDQMLIRAAIRMLLIMEDLGDWEASSERRAAQIVLTYLGSSTSS
jgi:Ser/Thr protein kinase RdoA (MazF antagonist)